MEVLVWPAVVLILGIFAIFMFKKPITRFIDRTEKVSKRGIQTKKVQEQYLESKKSRVADFLKNFDNQLLVETEKRISESLENLQPKDTEEREKYLRRILAETITASSFEKIYCSIYNSQLRTLGYLNENRNKNNTINDDIRIFYNEAVKNYPSYYESYSFDEWLNYLISWNLVLKNDSNISITLFGKEFLKYIIDQGYNLVKYG